MTHDEQDDPRWFIPWLFCRVIINKFLLSAHGLIWTYLPLRPEELRRDNITQSVSNMVKGYYGSLFRMSSRRISSPYHDDRIRDAGCRSDPDAGDESPTI